MHTHTHACAHTALSWPPSGPPLRLFKETTAMLGCRKASSLLCPHSDVSSRAGSRVPTSVACNFLSSTTSALHIKPRKGLRPTPKLKNRSCCKKWSLSLSPTARTSGHKQVHLLASLQSAQHPLSYSIEVSSSLGRWPAGGLEKATALPLPSSLLLICHRPLSNL